MFRFTVTAALALGLLCLWGAAPLAAQERCMDGNFELGDALGPWTLFGDNTGAGFVQKDVDGSGGPSWALERAPGVDLGNGGIQQNILLIGGVDYQFEADVLYYAC